MNIYEPGHWPQLQIQATLSRGRGVGRPAWILIVHHVSWFLVKQPPSGYLKNSELENYGIFYIENWKMAIEILSHSSMMLDGDSRKCIQTWW